MISIKTPRWLKQKRLSFKIGLISGLLHFVISLLIICNIIVWSQNAQWQFLWSLPFSIDFPFSVIYILIFYLPFPNFSFPFLPYPISELRDFILPCFLHCMLGTLWYFYLPLLVVKFFKKFSPIKLVNKALKILGIGDSRRGSQ